MCFPSGKTLARGNPWTPRPLTRNKPMPRPPLRDRQRRSRRVSVYISPDEWAVLDERSAQAQLSIPEYLRQRGLRDRLQIESPRRLDAKTFQELHRLGVNLNQCVRLMHRGRRPITKSGEGLKQVLEKVQRLLHRLMPEEPD